MDDLKEAIKEFLVESHENLEQLDLDLVALERGSGAPATISSIFRTIHTLKGSAAFLGFKRLESLTHVGEGLLSQLRDGRLAVTSEIISALLAMVDAVREMLREIESAGHDGQHNHGELVARLNALRPPAAATLPKKQSTSSPAPQLPLSELNTLCDLNLSPDEDLETAKENVDFDLQALPPDSKTELASIPTPSDRQRSTSALSAHLPRSTDRVREPAPSPSMRELDKALPEPAGREPAALAVAENTIRLDIGRLDKLMNLVSELVLARNQLLQHSAAQTDPHLVSASRQLNLITTELQEVVMAARVQPIGNLWAKLPRVVRDLTLECGKRMRLEMDGSDTELDKTVIDAIKDPLTHLVRNAVDHGIERPEARAAAGKPMEGRLVLRAYHEGGQVHIEITDDGAGIDPDRIKRRAIERGMITLDHADKLSESSALGLIFLPGFSTSDRVSTVSGRGVGMDVVKNNVEKIGGTVDLQSKPGVGTTVRLRIPLTLAIIRAVVIVSRGERFAIPQASIVELIRLEGEKARTGIERIHDAGVYRFRGRLLPIVYLSQVLGREPASNGYMRANETPVASTKPVSGESHRCATSTHRIGTSVETINIVVLQSGRQQFGLVVDRIIDAQEIVVKPLGKPLRGVPCLAGATIMGDGRVALILDVLGLAERAAIVSSSSTPGVPEAEFAEPVRVANDDQQQLVLVRGSGGERWAVPLEMVVRLEEFPASAIEHAGAQRVIQYRGQILPLVDVTAALNPGACGAPEVMDDPDQRLPVVVCSDRTRQVGLLVNRILDVLSESTAVKSRATREHVLYTAVVRQQVTEVLNVAGLIQLGETACAVTTGR